jgi:hypothetical protein
MREYISATEAAKRLQCNARHVAELVRLGKIGVRRLPGVAQDRYRLADVERIAVEAFIPAREVPAASPARSSKRRRPAALSG